VTEGPTPASTTAIILCGGRSRRFGGDKALATVGGRTLLDRAIDTAGARADRIVLACGPTPRYAEYGLELVTDTPGIEGPLAGFRAGLAAAGTEYVLMMAVDLPFVTPPAIDMLIQRLIEFESDGVVPRSRDGLEPVLQFGRRATYLAAADELALTGDPAPRRLSEFMMIEELTVSANPHDPLRRAIANINTPQDLAALAG
jgi:molybdopterin-guanine dinucleotide biosynthesis protein A